MFFLISTLTIEHYAHSCRKLCRVIIPIVYTLFIGLRHTSIGTDTLTYYEHYYTYGRWGCYFVEPGFDWINRVMYGMGYNANAFFIVLAAITSLFLYLSLNKLKEGYTIAAFCMYLLTFSFLINGMRQGIACAIFLYSCNFIITRRPLIYLLLILLASSFHASAIILLPLYFLKDYSFPKEVYVIIYVLSFIGVFTNISSYLPRLELFGRDYSIHLEENLVVASASSLGFIIACILNVVILSLMIKNNQFKENPLLANFVFIALCLKNIGFNLPIIGRLTIYFTWFIYLMYPKILSRKSKPLFGNMDLTRALIFIIVMAIWMNNLTFAGNRQIPYLFYWE